MRGQEGTTIGNDTREYCAEYQIHSEEDESTAADHCNNETMDVGIVDDDMAEWTDSELAREVCDLTKEICGIGPHVRNQTVHNLQWFQCKSGSDAKAVHINYVLAQVNRYSWRSDDQTLLQN